MEKTFKNEVINALLEHEGGINLDHVKEVGVSEFLFLFYLWDNLNVFRPEEIDISKAANSVGITIDEITKTFIPKLENDYTCRFKFDDGKWFFSIGNHLTSRIIHFCRGGGERRIVFSPKIRIDFSYKDSYNFGILLKYASDLNNVVDGNDYVFNLKKEWYDEFFPKKDEIFTTIMNFHKKGYNFVEFEGDSDNFDEIRFIFHIKELKEYFRI